MTSPAFPSCMGLSQLTSGFIGKLSQERMLLYSITRIKARPLEIGFMRSILCWLHNKDSLMQRH